MNNQTKKTFSIILALTFVILNLLHVIWPCWLIIEDIKLGTMVGTNMEMAVLFPWILEFLSIPVIIGQIIYLIINRKNITSYKFNLISFFIYIFQVVLFNVLLRF